MGLLDRAGGRLSHTAPRPATRGSLLSRASGALSRTSANSQTQSGGTLRAQSSKAPPASPPPSAPSQSSLLRRARSFIASGSGPRRAAAADISYPDVDLDEASLAIDAIPLTAEYPIKLFEVLRDILSVSSGGLFFLDRAEGMYAPLAMAGFDQTTRHRLRLPPAFVDEACAAGPVLLGGPALDAFRMFFSSQGFRRLGALRLIPLPFGADEPEQEGTALILAAEAERPASASAVPVNWAQLSPFLGERLSAWAARFGKSFLAPGKRGAEAEDEAEGMREALSEIKRRGLKAAFIVLPFQAALASMERANPQADRYRLFAEARSVVSGMVTAPGRVVPLKRYRLGILFCRPSAPDAELFLHQMRAPLAKAFPSLAGLALAAEATVDPLARPEDFERLLSQGAPLNAAGDGA